MKLSKLDPMTVLMLVVAFGVVITMLTQNSVASVDKTSLKTDVLEKSTSIDMRVSKVSVNGGDVYTKTLHAAYNDPITAKNAPEVKESKAEFF